MKASPHGFSCRKNRMEHAWKKSVAPIRILARKIVPRNLSNTELCLMYLEKRSCQLFYYCVHMARKTTPLCYVSFYVRCSVYHLGYVSLYVRCSVLDLPTGGSRVLCTCTADIVLQCSPCSDVHARGTSSFGTASCMSCFGYFLSWPGLFRFGAAETSFRGILLNDR